MNGNAINRCHHSYCYCYDPLTGASKSAVTWMSLMENIQMCSLHLHDLPKLGSYPSNYGAKLN